MSARPVTLTDIAAEVRRIHDTAVRCLDAVGDNLLHGAEHREVLGTIADVMDDMRADLAALLRRVEESAHPVQAALIGAGGFVGATIPRWSVEPRWAVIDATGEVQPLIHDDEQAANDRRNRLNADAEALPTDAELDSFESAIGAGPEHEPTAFEEAAAILADPDRAAKYAGVVIDTAWAVVREEQARLAEASESGEEVQP